MIWPENPSHAHVSLSFPFICYSLAALFPLLKFLSDNVTTTFFVVLDRRYVFAKRKEKLLLCVSLLFSLFICRSFYFFLLFLLFCFSSHKKFYFFALSTFSLFLLFCFSPLLLVPNNQGEKNYKDVLVLAGIVFKEIYRRPAPPSRRRKKERNTQLR